MRTIITTIVSVVITAGMSFILNYYNMSNGSIGFNQDVKIQNTNYSIVTIENSSEKLLNELKLNISKDININDITTSNHINIIINDKFKTNQKVNQIIINDIPDGLLTQIFIPMKKNDTFIEIVNPKELNLEIKDPRYATNKIKKIIDESIQTATVYFIVFSFFYYLMQQSINTNISKINKLNEEAKEAREKLEKNAKNLEKKSKELKKEHMKIKLLYLSRLQDYAKELTFWRDTIRKIMYETTNKKSDAELIIDTVTKSLKTYHTRNEKDIEFTTLKMLDKLNQK